MGHILQLPGGKSVGRMEGMARLATGLLTGRLLHHGLLRTGRIRRRRQGRIPRILPKLLLELLDPLSRIIQLRGHQLKLLFGVLNIGREFGPKLLTVGALNLAHSSSLTLFTPKHERYFW